MLSIIILIIFEKLKYRNYTKQYTMAILNEELIRKVFDDMVKYRPALAKYLIVDEDEDEDDEVDYRILGDLIILGQ